MHCIAQRKQGTDPFVVSRDETLVSGRGENICNCLNGEGRP